MAKSLQELIDESIKNSEKTEEIVPEKENVTEEKEVEKKPKKVGTIIKANIGRGFRNIEEATKFYESDTFAKWDDSAKKEFKTWLDKIKED